MKSTLITNAAAALTIAALAVGASTAQADFYVGSQTSADSIVGQDEGGGGALGYDANTSNNVSGVSGPGGSRTKTNVVLGFTLPTLTPGQTIDEVALSFELTRGRNFGGGAAPQIDAYLLDTANPDVTGTSFFFQGNSDASASVEFIDRTSAATASTEVVYPDDSEDRSFVLSGDALTLFKSYYGGDHIPDQTEAFFRFNLDLGGASLDYDRYRVDLATDESNLQITTVSSDNLLYDTFQAYSPDVSLGTSGPWSTVSGSSETVVRDQDTADPFATSPNQYLEFNDDSTTASVRVQSPNFSEASGGVTTFAFDFVETSAGDSGSLIFGYANSGADLNGAGRRLSMNLDDGAITGLSVAADNTYSLDTEYRVYIVFNDTGSAFSYLGGTIDAGSAHVWLEDALGMLKFAGTRAAFNSQTSAYRVGFRSFSSNLQEVLIDNVSLDEGATVPLVVPAPAALPAGLALLGIAAMRRRR